MEQKNVYGAKEAASLLNVKESTVRKYALLLEEAGYHFDKDPARGRAFYDKDVIAMRRMMDGSKGADMTLKQAAHAVVTAMADTSEAPAVMDDITQSDRYVERYINEIEGLKEIINKQGGMLLHLKERLEEESAARRETERVMLDKLGQISDKQESLNAPVEEEPIDLWGEDSKEEIEPPQEEEKPSFWKRLFK